MADLDHNYSNEPQTIAELSASKTGNSQNWSVREMLIAALREIDNGEEYRQAMLVYVDKNDRVSYWGAKNTTFDSIAMLEMCKVLVMKL